MTLVARPQSYVDAIAASTSESAGAAAAPVEFDASLYPEKLGKYWLGPIDPTRPHDEPQGGYGLVKAGIDSQTERRPLQTQASFLCLQGTRRRWKGCWEGWIRPPLSWYAAPPAFAVLRLGWLAPPCPSLRLTNGRCAGSLPGTSSRNGWSK